MTTQRKTHWLVEVALCAALLIAAGAALFFNVANAQTDPTFTCTNTTGPSPLSTSCSWSIPAATTCTAGGVGVFTGSIPCTGTRNFSGVMVPMTLFIDPVAAPTGGKMSLRWIKPTKNTDGTNLTSLGGYLIEYGTASGSLTQTRSIPLASVTALTPTATDPLDSLYVLDSLTSGTWFAALKVRTAGCFPTQAQDCYESVRTNVASAPVTTTPGGALPRLSVTLDPYKVPMPATGLVATEVVAFQIDANEDGTLVATRVELVPVSTSCVDNECTVLARRQ
jgi:hypothetical protein